MDNALLNRIRDLMQEKCGELSLQLVSVRFYANGENGPTLEVLIDKDYDIDLETIEKYTDIVSPLLDEIEELQENYILEIASGGSEREIPKEDLERFVDSYLDIVIKKSGEKITAKLENFDEEKMNVFYFIKGRRKKLSLSYDELSSVRMGYKA